MRISWLQTQPDDYTTSVKITLMISTDAFRVPQYQCPFRCLLKVDKTAHGMRDLANFVISFQASLKEIFRNQERRGR